MAFSKAGLTISRGTANTSGTPTGFVQHTYTSIDSLAVISAAGYFPENFGASPEEIQIGDLITLSGTGNYRAYKITSISPPIVEEEAITDNPFDQSLNTYDSVTFASTDLTPIAANPGGTDTLWINSADNHLNRGPVDIEGGMGDVMGPVSSTDEALTRFDGITGELLQDSTVTLDDAATMTFPAGGDMAIPLICTAQIQELVNGDGIKIKGLGNTTLMRIGDVIDNPKTQNTLMNFQAKQDVLFYLEGDTDDVGMGDTPLIKMTSQANSSMLNICIDTTGDSVIDLGSAGLPDKDFIFRTGGDYVTAPPTGTAPDYSGGGATAPTVALKIKGDTNVELTQFVGGGTSPAAINDLGYIVRGDTTKTEYFYPMNSVGTTSTDIAIDGNYLLMHTDASNDFLYMTFNVPPDFVSLTSLTVLAWPDATAAGSPRSLDIDASYGGIGEDRDDNNASITSPTTDFGAAEVIFEVDVSGAYVDLEAGDICALKVTPTNINSGELFWHSLKLTYSTV